MVFDYFYYKCGGVICWSRASENFYESSLIYSGENMFSTIRLKLHKNFKAKLRKLLFNITFTTYTRTA